MAAEESQAPAPETPVAESGSPTLSRNQLKKQKKAAKKVGTEPPATNGIHDPKEAALTDHAPEKSEIAQGKVDPSLVAGKEELNEAIKDDGPKFATVEFVNRRIKTMKKKVDRILGYAHKPKAELNEDQKKTVESLPGLQGALKELEEVKKGLELIEIEQTVARETERQLEAADAAAAVTAAVQVAQEAQAQSFKLVLDFLRFYQALMQGAVAHPSLGVTDPELAAIHHAHGRLMHPEEHVDVMRGLMGGEGEVEGVEYLRLRDILGSYMNPVPEPEPVVEPTPDEVDAAYTAALGEAIAEQAVAETLAEPMDAAPLYAGPAPPTGGFMFMNPDELDPATGLNGYEEQRMQHVADAEADQMMGMQQVADAEADQALDAVEQAIAEAELEAEVQEAIEEAVAEAVLEEAIEEALEEAALAPVNAGPIDWAAHGDDGELPDLGDLQAGFGSTGAHTPEIPAPEVVVIEVAAVEPAVAPEAEPSAPPTRPRAWGPRGGARGGAEGGERGFRGGRGGNRGGRGGGYRGRGGLNGAGPYTPAAAGVPGQNGHAAPVPVAEEEDGWATVASKRGARGGSGFRGGRGEGRGRGEFRGEFRGRGGERGRGEGFRGRGGPSGERGGEFRGRGMRGGNRGARGAPNGNGAPAEAAAPAASS